LLPNSINIFIQLTISSNVFKNLIIVPLKRSSKDGPLTDQLTCRATRRGDPKGLPKTARQADQPARRATRRGRTTDQPAHRTTLPSNQVKRGCRPICLASNPARRQPTLWRAYLQEGRVNLALSSHDGTMTQIVTSHDRTVGTVPKGICQERRQIRSGE
jgi:hypothetical protein